ncbi:MAG: hypothetical protein WC570_01255 [Patescibacteria group bacterium]
MKYDVQNGSPAVRNFASKEPDRLIGTKNIPGETDYFQLITMSPLYFDVKAPRPFAKATVTLKYQNPQSQEVVQLGVQQSNAAYAYYPMAYANSTLNSLGDYWQVMQSGDVYLWQKNIEYFQNVQNEKKIYDSRKKKLDDWKTKQLKLATTNDQKQTIENQYSQELDQISQDTQVDKSGSVPFSSINDFLGHIPPREQVAQYNYDLSAYYELPGYKPSKEATEINHSLRGKHEIYTYIGDGESLNFSFVVQDINRHAGEDSITFSVIGPTGAILKKIIEPDDGDTNADGHVNSERVVDLLLPDLPHGVYRIVLDTNDDMFIKKIVTFQHLVMFKGILYLTDNSEYKSIVGDRQFSPTTVYTNSSILSAYTSHDANLQTLRVGTRNIELTSANELVDVTLNQPITSITTSKNDVSLQGNGYFAFTKDQLFDPNISLVVSVNDITNIDDYDFIIATYTQPASEGDWLIASATVEAPQLFFDKGSDLLAHFIINLPNFHESGKILKVKEISINFEKPPLTLSRIWSKIIGLVNK